MNLKKSIFLFLLTISAPTLDQAFGWTYSSATATGTCGNLDETGSASDFTFTSIINKSKFASPGVSDVLKMAFIMPTPTSKNADIVFVERFGMVKYFDAQASKLTLIGTLSKVGLETEDGLVGVAVEKPFQNRVYVAYSYSPNASTSNSTISGSYRISRFSMNPTTHMMDMSAEQVILDIPSVRNRWHTSGGMDFDNEGNLYMAVGDNETAFTGPGNTHDLRGGVIRIKPNPTGAGYTIPKDNFGEYWAKKFRDAGRTTLATQYEDTSKVKPEIFIKGTRNTYAFSIDPYRKQVVYGQCGPDYGGNSEVHHNSLTPAFTNWPFWSGTTTVANSQASGSQYGKNGASEPSTSQWTTNLPASKDKPVNSWAATMSGAPSHGADTLPPADPPKFSYARSCAMGSLILHYDGRVTNPGKMPPQYDNVWLMGDYNTRKLRAAKVDASGNISGTPNAGIFTSGSGTADGISALVDLQQGPDGALYAVNLNCTGGFNSGPSSHYSDACSGIVRIEYKGTCADTALHPAGPNPSTGIVQSEKVFRDAVGWLDLKSNMFAVKVDGAHFIRIMDVQGRVKKSMQGEGHKEYQIPGNLISNEVYFLEVKTSLGTNIRGFMQP